MSGARMSGILQMQTPRTMSFVYKTSTGLDGPCQRATTFRTQEQSQHGHHGKIYVRATTQLLVHFTFCGGRGEKKKRRKSASAYCIK